MSVNGDALDQSGGKSSTSVKELTQLEGAQKDLQQAGPKLAVSDCEQQQKPDNIVKPIVTVDRPMGFVALKKKSARPACVIISIDETEEDPPFQGTGEVSAPGATLFFDEDCRKPVTKPFPASALREKEVPIYVRTTDPADVTVTLKLSGPKVDRQQVKESDSRQVRMEAIKIVTPSVAVEVPETFFDDKLIVIPCALIARITETKAPTIFNGTGTVTASPAVKLYSDESCASNTELVQPLTAAALLKGVPFFAGATTTGSITFTLTLADPNDHGIVVEACQPARVKARQVIVITPKIALVNQGKGHVYAHEARPQFVPAQVSAAITMTAQDVPFKGTGVVSVVSPDSQASLWGDGKCNGELKPLSAEALLKKEGTPIFVKGTVANSDVKLQLTIDPPADKRFRVATAEEIKDKDKGTVKFLPFNTVTPQVVPDSSFGIADGRASNAVKLILGFVESEKAPPFVGTGVLKLTGVGAVFSDATCKTPFAKGYPAPLQAAQLRKGVPAYATYGALGTATFTLTLTSAEGGGIIVLEPKPVDVKFINVNEVSPIVTVEKFRGFHHAEHFVPAEVTLKIQETGDEPPFAGTGNVIVYDGSAELFRDKKCEVPAKQFDAEELRGKGFLIYVKGVEPKEKSKARPDGVTVKLLLKDAEQRGVRIASPFMEQKVTLPALNFITPRLTGDELVLVDAGFEKEFVTTRSALSIGFDQTSPAAGAPPDLAIKMTYGAQIECREAGKDQVFDRDTVFALPEKKSALTFGARGISRGACTVTVSLQGSPGEGWRLDTAPISKDLWVEKLKLDAYLFKDGSLVKGDVSSMATGKPEERTPKNRKLHQRDKDIFTFARLIMRRPSAEFWTKASGITFAGHGKIGAYVDKDAKKQIKSLARADFGDSGDYELWSATTDDYPAALDGESSRGVAIDFSKWSEHKLLEELDPRHLSCGATVAGTDSALQIGDLVRLDTFSFDRRLDRAVHNACGRRLKRGAEGLKEESAIAQTAANQYYDLVSDFWGNRYYRKSGQSPFNDFISAMKSRFADRNKMADAGVAFIEQHLQTHDVRFVGGMRARVRGYILGVIDDWAKRMDALKDIEARRKYDEEIRKEFEAWDDRIRQLTIGKSEALKEVKGQSNEGAVEADWNIRIRKVEGPKENRQRQLDADKSSYSFDLLYGLPGTHAEVLAANELMQAGHTPDKLTVATYMVQVQPGRQGKRFEACPHCSGILLGQDPPFRVITEP